MLGEKDAGNGEREKKCVPLRYDELHFPRKVKTNIVHGGQARRCLALEGNFRGTKPSANESGYRREREKKNASCWEKTSEEENASAFRSPFPYVRVSRSTAVSW